MSQVESIIKVSAPGKVILHGEHSVVYGKKAIAVSVGLLTTVTIKPAQDVNIKFPDVGIDATFDLDTLCKLKTSLRSDFRYEILNASEQIPIWDNVRSQIAEFSNGRINQSCVDEILRPAQKTALESFLFIYLSVLDKPLGLHISVDTKLPVGAGLGSSASFGVALAGAILLAGERIPPGKLDNDLINRWAFVSEKFVHGSPSGVDNTVATFGSGVIFQKDKDVEFIQDFPDIRVLLVNTKVPRSTKVLVGIVAKLRDTNPSVFKSIVDGIETVVESAIQEIKKQKRISPQLISKNHDYLEALGVSHPSLEFIVQLAQEYGFAGKLTGAGGGGCALVFIPPGTKENSVTGLKSALEQKGLEFWDTKLGCPGVARCKV